MGYVYTGPFEFYSPYIGKNHGEAWPFLIRNQGQIGALAAAESEQLACLFVAAPELLDLLKDYVSGDECDVDGAPDANNSRHNETCRWCLAQFAIAKAEGKEKT